MAEYVLGYILLLERKLLLAKTQQEAKVPGSPSTGSLLRLGLCGCLCLCFSASLLFSLSLRLCVCSLCLSVRLAVSVCLCSI